MGIFVADTSVLIDLERGSLQERAFALPYEYAVPDLLYKRELLEYGGEYLIELGLRVEELQDSGVELAQEYRNQSSAISAPDSFALALAVERRWALLTGDKALRELAEANGVKYHGVLWVLDEMEERGAASPRTLTCALLAITGHERCRLPRREVRARLERYAGRVGST